MSNSGWEDWPSDAAIVFFQKFVQCCFYTSQIQLKCIYKSKNETLKNFRKISLIKKNFHVS